MDTFELNSDARALGASDGDSPSAVPCVMSSYLDADQGNRPPEKSARDVLSATGVNRDRHDAQQAVVLAATGVRKGYSIGGEKRWVLDGVDFHVQAGECVFLSGPSGSGKSTLLSIIGCLLQGDAGEVKLGNRRVDHLSVAQRTAVRRQHIGFVFQRFQLIRGLSALDNVAVPLTLQGVSLPESRERSAAILKRVGLELHCNQLPSSMSPGQCQRVALARAVVTAPKLLLADEPTAALDRQSGQEVMDLLRELIDTTQSATVVVTHDPRISSYADRICEIENGRLL